jgi:magnesium chelatase subunit I
MVSPRAVDEPRAETLGALRASGWVSIPVREEIRGNLLRRIAAGQPAISGVLGFEDTIVPQLEHALIAGHDVIFLGERGQAKSRSSTSGRRSSPARRSTTTRTTR